VQPVYLRAEGGRIPELKRVVVAHQNQVVMEERLEDGLSRLFGDGFAELVASSAESGEPAAQTSATPDLTRRALNTYQRALEAQRAGDWTRYGEEINRLGEILRQMESPR
jgi:uncharacterized membrane protein (UPF0182 family)